MTPVVFVIAYGLTVAVVGYAVVSAVVGRSVRHWAEVAGLSVAAGVGLTGFALFDVSIASVPPGRGVLAGWAVVGGLLTTAVILGRGRLAAVTVPTPVRRIDPAGIVGGLAAVVIVAAVLNAAAAGTAPGLGDIDEYATWMFKAKVAAVVPLRPVPAALLDPGLSYSHQDYPLLFPLLVAGAYAAAGRVDPSVGKLVLLPMYLGLIGVVYGAVRRDHRRATALALTAVAAAGPTVAQKAGLAVAELPLTLFVAAAVSTLARWVDRGDRGDVLLCGGFAAAAAFSKNEGLALLPVFAVAIGVGVWLRRPSRSLRYAEEPGRSDPGVRRTSDSAWRNLTWTALVAVVLIAPWLAYRTLLPKTHEDYGGKFADPATLSQGLRRLPHVLAAVTGWMLDLPTAGGVWVVLAVAAVVGWRAWRVPAVRVVWVVLAVQIGLYALAFCVTPWPVEVLVPMVTAKLLAQAAPVAGVLAGLHLRRQVADAAVRR